MQTRIRGRIIRIVDANTVVINLGSNHGVTEESVFSILGEPEPVIDPQTNEELGTVQYPKGRVKAFHVSEKFSIASSTWTSRSLNVTNLFPSLRALAGMEELEVKVNEHLRVQSSDVMPWKAKSEEFVRVGDEVAVYVEVVEEADEGTTEAPAPDSEPESADEMTVDDANTSGSGEHKDG